MENEKKSNNLFAEAVALDMLFGANHKLSKPTEGKTTTIHTEAVVDFDHVSIPISRFEEMVRAEEQLDIVLRSYRRLKNYQLDDILAIILGPRPEEGGDSAQ